jgi:thiosulfate reductase cytochrome b subunit
MYQALLMIHFLALAISVLIVIVAVLVFDQRAAVPQGNRMDEFGRIVL